MIDLFSEEKEKEIDLDGDRCIFGMHVINHEYFIITLKCAYRMYVHDLMNMTILGVEAETLN